MPSAQFPVCAGRRYAYIQRMNWLTRQEQYVLGMVLTLLLVGLAVKTYRTAHPTTAAATVVLEPGNHAPAGTE